MNHRALVLLLLTASASAEVMDKEPALAQIWAGAALGAGLAWLLGRFRPWLGWLALLPALPALLAVEECHDRFIGPAIFHEAGPGYVAQAHLAVALVLLSFVAGLARRRRARPTAFGIHTRE